MAVTCRSRIGIECPALRGVSRPAALGASDAVGSRLRVGLLACVLMCLLAGLLPGLGGSAGAQTLARPEWRGSGMNNEAWWRSAIFYQVAPEHFQDSDGDGVGDLRGVAQRLEYLQSLGVDALVLQLPFDDSGFDDLLPEASRHHIRLVIGLNGRDLGSDDLASGPNGRAADPAALVAQARQWLSRGAAGILLPDLSGVVPEEKSAELRRAVRQLAGSFPGERIVVDHNPSPLRVGEPQPAARHVQRAGRHAGGRHGAGRHQARMRDAEAREDGTREVGMHPDRGESPEIALYTLSLEGGAGAGQFPASIAAALTGPTSLEGAPMLLALQSRATGAAAHEQAGPAANQAFGELASNRGSPAIAAAVLLTQRSAVLLDYGQELGAERPEHMPWTPSNVTPPPPPPPEPAEAAAPPVPTPSSAPPSTSDVYGAFKPYVPPPPPIKAKPQTGEADAQLPAPDSLPGFSTRAVEREGEAVPTAGGMNAAGLNQAEVHPAGRVPGVPLRVSSVALQDRDPHSLLNLYRALAALHHGNATLRNGSLALLHSDGGTLVWLRRAPAGARTVASVVVAVNCGGAPVTLSLRSDFERLHLRPGSLRSLVTTGSRAEPQSSERLTLAAGAVFVGELYHGR